MPGEIVYRRHIWTADVEVGPSGAGLGCISLTVLS